MREGWKVKTLGEVIEKSGTIDPRKAPAEQFQYVDVSSVSRKSNKIEEVATLLGADAPSRARRLIKFGDVIFATIRPTLQRIAQVPEELDGQVCSTGYFVFRTKPEVEPRYLYYYLFSTGFMDSMETLQSGASYPAVNDSQVKSQTIPLPPLAEQKRIVALLDQAFEGIELALAAASKNLKNARELFETTLNTTFTQKGEGWVEKRMDEIANLSRGHNPLKSQFSNAPQEGFVRFYQIRDGKSDKFAVYVPDSPKLHRVEETEILMVAYRHIGGVFRGVNGAFNVALCKISNKDESVILDDYLYQIIPTPYVKGELLKHSERSLIPSMSVKHLASIKIPVPPIEQQRLMVQNINEIQSQTQSLETLYQQKIDALNELKQSLLQKAFAGELTAQATDTLSPEFAANVIAYAFRKHETATRDKSYKRVKSQKCLHLVEYVGGVDLGRDPAKYAAGPHDEKHMKQAEGWAKENQFFEFVRRSEREGYDFTKLARFDELIGKAVTVLEPYQAGLDKAIAPLVQKDKIGAEVFTTVYAAWNNLIIDDVAITDEAIVTEAREDWHSGKLNIARNKFFEAIRDIRQRGLEPDGTGKRVDGQGELF